MRENFQYALTKSSRFLDTSLRVNELAQREKVFDSELDEEIKRIENEPIGNEMDENVSNTQDVDSNGLPTVKTNRPSDEGEFSDAEQNATSRSKKKKQSENKRKEIRRLLMMHTMDFKFYRPSASEMQKTKARSNSSQMHFWSMQEGAGESKQRDQDSMEIQLKHAKMLLMRKRNEEMSLRRTDLEKAKQGFDEFMFELNSSQHRQTILNERDQLRKFIKNLADQYMKQGGENYLESAGWPDEEEGFINVQPHELEETQREYEESKQSKESSAKVCFVAKHFLNTSKQDFGRSDQPISMLEMAFNEINPYRETKIGQGSIMTTDSMNLTLPHNNNSKEHDSFGGSM